MAQGPLAAQSLPSQSERSITISPGSNGRGTAASPVRLFMTSDVRAATGLSRTHLDFYIREGLVHPVARTESGYLLFDQAEVELLNAIVAERRSGVSLKDIRQRIGR